ncbi:hypothetical protein FSP39_024218 [Pinctada imbricata]|uniref:Uncharacterized protein n=1 Tax=Pinctada imbricata TaxID=66713 RepID=A0AA88YPI6_PINIB|nr:hypothetical protein FSP39_024218 [Pinctada imbricata]
MAQNLRKSTNGTNNENENVMAVEVEVHKHPEQVDQGVSRKRLFSGNNPTSQSPVLKRSKNDKYLTESDSDSDAEYIDNSTIFRMFNSLSSQMTGLSDQYNELKDRILTIEANLEAKLSQKFKSVLDTRFEVELSDVKAEVTANIAVVRSEVNKKCDEMGKLYAEAVSCNLMGKQESTSVIVKMLPEDRNEDKNKDITKNRVDALVRDGLRFRDVRVKEAERKKKNGTGRNPGIVKVTFETKEQKEKVLKEKQKLKQSKEYRNVYIEEELTREQLNADSNMRTILKEIGKDKTYCVKNGQIKRRLNNGQSRGTGSYDSRESHERSEGWRTQNRRGNNYRGRGSRGGRR